MALFFSSSYEWKTLENEHNKKNYIYKIPILSAIFNREF